MMRQAEICIDNDNHIKALKILEELETFMTDKHDFKDQEHHIFFTSRLYTLQAIASSYLNQLVTARDLLRKSCDMLRLKFPKENHLNVKYALRLVKKTKRFLRHNTYGAKTSNVTLIYELITIQIAECATAMFALFKKTKEHDMSLAMAAIALYKVVRYSHNYTFIINCYANFLNVGTINKYGIRKSFKKTF